MSDRLREALGYMDWIHDVAADWPDVDENYEIIAAAVRRFLALAETGRRVEWCENHNAAASSDGWFANELRCREWWWGEAHPDPPLLDPYACRIVSKWLSDYLTEEETA